MLQAFITSRLDSSNALYYGITDDLMRRLQSAALASSAAARRVEGLHPGAGCPPCFAWARSHLLGWWLLPCHRRLPKKTALDWHSYTLLVSWTCTKFGDRDFCAAGSCSGLVQSVDGPQKAEIGTERTLFYIAKQHAFCWTRTHLLPWSYSLQWMLKRTLFSTDCGNEIRIPKLN